MSIISLLFIFYFSMCLLVLRRLTTAAKTGIEASTVAPDNNHSFFVIGDNENTSLPIGVMKANTIIALIKSPKNTLNGVNGNETLNNITILTPANINTAKVCAF